MFEFPKLSETTRIWLVTRHPGAVIWVQARGIRFDCHVSHLDVARIRPGDTVMGSLPIHLAAEVLERGARYFNLSLEVPFDLRGRELSPQTLRECNARLEEFRVLRQGAAAPLADRKFADANESVTAA